MSIRGFTLLEVILAVSLSGAAVLVGALLWRQSLVGGAALTEHRVAVDREAGARRWLQAVIGSIDVGAEGDVPFTGHREQVSFTTWLTTTNGWPERRAVTIGAEQGSLAVAGALEGPLPLVDSITGVAFDYLLEPGLNSQWVSSWESPVSAPLAIRVRITQPDRTIDTLLFLIGARG